MQCRPLWKGRSEIFEWKRSYRTVDKQSQERLLNLTLIFCHLLSWCQNWCQTVVSSAFCTKLCSAIVIWRQTFSKLIKCSIKSTVTTYQIMYRLFSSPWRKIYWNYSNLVCNTFICAKFTNCFMWVFIGNCSSSQRHPWGLWEESISFSFVEQMGSKSIQMSPYNQTTVCTYYCNLYTINSAEACNKGHITITK